MKIQLRLFANQNNGQFLELELPKGTKIRELRKILEAQPYSLPDVIRSDVVRFLKKAQGGVYIALLDTDKVGARIMIHGVEQLPLVENVVENAVRVASPIRSSPPSSKSSPSTAQKLSRSPSPRKNDLSKPATTTGKFSDLTRQPMDEWRNAYFSPPKRKTSRDSSISSPESPERDHQLSLSEALALQTDLRKGFMDQKFQRSMRSLRSRYNLSDSKDRMACAEEMQATCWVVQKEILPKYGFGADRDSLPRMMRSFRGVNNHPEIKNNTEEIKRAILFGLTEDNKVPDAQEDQETSNASEISQPSVTKYPHVTQSSKLSGNIHRELEKYLAGCDLADRAMIRQKSSYPLALACPLVMNVEHEGLNLTPGPTVIWVIVSSELLEVQLAQEGIFDMLGSILRLTSLSIVLFVESEIEDSQSILSNDSSSRVSVQVRKGVVSDLISSSSSPPTLAVCFHTGVGTLSRPLVEKWVPLLCKLLRLKTPVLLTSRCQQEAEGDQRVLSALGCAKPKNWLLRNDPLKDGGEGPNGLSSNWSGYCDNAFLVVAKADFDVVPQNAAAIDLVVEKLCALENGANANGGSGSRVADPQRIVFWGILDLKYDPNLPMEQRVKVLETGDGRSSRFSGYGQAILQRLEAQYKLDKGIRRAVMVENKRLTHDLFVECGFEHLVPRQACFSREYSPDLAKKIAVELGLTPEEKVVLKLCNRSRGAGIIVLSTSELDSVLRVLLGAPKDLEAWLALQDSSVSCGLTWGCLEEQVRHWWSNESPCFIAERCYYSMGVQRDGRIFDGTMRIGFVLHRPPVPTSPRQRSQREVSENDDNPAEYEEETERFISENSSLPVVGDREMLAVEFLGGYWKLPKEDLDSPDLRGRVVSHAKTGTLPVEPSDLHEVYATLSTAVPEIFASPDLGAPALMRRYASDPYFVGFVVTRLAASARMRDLSKAHAFLALARSVARRGSASIQGMPASSVESYIERTRGIFAAQSGNWGEAAESFRTSLRWLPTNATSHYLLGMAQLENNDAQDAVDSFERSLALDPDFKAPYCNLGVAWLALKEYGRVVWISDMGLRRHPGTFQCYYNLGVAAYQLACVVKNEAETLRSRSSEALKFAKDHRGKHWQWHFDDEAMLTALGRQEPLPSIQTRPGWKFYGWRP